MHRPYALHLFVCAAVLAATLHAQVPGAQPTATAAVSGVVVDGTTNAPIEGAMVALLLDGRAASGDFGRRVLTDDKGRFVFTGLAGNDRLTVSASKPGFLDGGFGLGAGATGGRVVLRDGEWAHDVRVKLWRPSVIAGAILDERGEPVVDVYVQAYRRTTVLGTSQIVAGPLTTTDDRGRYRFADLVPGDYIIQVPSAQALMGSGPGNLRMALLTPDDVTRLMPSHYPITPPASEGRRFSYPPMFYPSARSLDQATPIAVGFAEERSGVDVHIAPVQAFRIAGMIDGPAEARGNLPVRLFPAGSELLGTGGEAAFTRTSEDGRFAFVNVPAGTYTIDTLLTTTHLSERQQTIRLPYDVSGGGEAIDLDIGPAGLMLESTYAGPIRPSPVLVRQSIVIERDDDQIVIPTRLAGVMSGRILKDIVPDVPVYGLEPGTTIRLNPADGTPSLGMRKNIDRTPDRFNIDGLLPGKYVLSIATGPGRGWLVKSVIWRGRDYTDAPFDIAETPELRDVEVVVTNGGGELSGVVRNRDGNPVSDATVIVFPSANALWSNVGFFPQRIRATSTGGNGRYTLSRIPAGEYKVVAIEGSVRPDIEIFQASQTSATSLTLSWTDKKSLDLVARGAPR